MFNQDIEKTEEQELQENLEKIDEVGTPNVLKPYITSIAAPRLPSYPNGNGKSGSKVQWSTANMKDFYPIGKTVQILTPGYYETDYDGNNFFLKRIETSTEGLIKFPDGNEDEVISEIESFWKKEQDFKDSDLTYKRGILLWGPPGGGKTSTCRQLLKSVIDLNGVCLKFNNPEYTKKGIRFIKEIQRNIPLIVLMEDLDSLFEIHEDTEILNLLDGIEDTFNTVFIATTNYPQKLKPRVVNRPSRFDKRFKIGFPSKESRKIYLDHLFSKRKDCKIDIDKWVNDTDNFTISHLKELFISVILFENNYDNALKILRSMKEEMTDKEGLLKMGFGSD